MPTQLYYVRTVAAEHKGWTNVEFIWFNIEAYRHDRWFARDGSDELFTEVEAQQVKEYLDREHSGESRIVAVPLPLPTEHVQIDELLVGDGDDFYMLDQEPGYSLPLRVWGLRIRGMRQQTNEEAAREALNTPFAPRDMKERGRLDARAADSDIPF